MIVVFALMLRRLDDYRNGIPPIILITLWRIKNYESQAHTSAFNVNFIHTINLEFDLDISGQWYYGYAPFHVPKPFSGLTFGVANRWNSVSRISWNNVDCLRITFL